MRQDAIERFDIIVIGAGQAGLAMGHHLKRQGLDFVILEAHERVGDVWRKRWDSLRLFSYAEFDGLPGAPFPAHKTAFPTKDEMGDYLERYAATFELPVRTGVRVDRLTRDDEDFIIEAGAARFAAKRVIVAMANYQQPKLPDFASQLDAGIVQLHSRQYRNPAQLQPGGVLVVGAGNSGAEIAYELARAGKKTWLAGRDVGQIPWDGESLASRAFLQRFLFRVVFHRLLSTRTPIGRKARSKGHSTTPLIRIKNPQMKRAGITRVGRVAGVRAGKPQLDDGDVLDVLDVRNVVWATGYELGFSWIDLPVFGANGEPRHVRGIATDVPGLYFVGLHFLYAMSSAMIHGVGRDAAFIADVVASARATAAAPHVGLRARERRAPNRRAARSAADR